MFNPQIEEMKPWDKIYLKAMTTPESYVYGQIFSFFELKKGNVFMVHDDEGPVSNEAGCIEFRATSDPYLDELGIPCIDIVEAKSNLPRGKPPWFPVPNFYDDAMKENGWGPICYNYQR